MNMINFSPLSRRAFLSHYAGSLGPLALAYLLAQDKARGETGARPAHLASLPGGGKAKSVICLFQHGGPSQMDLFDPKPQLARHNGEAYPGKVEVHFAHASTNLLA